MCESKLNQEIKVGSIVMLDPDKEGFRQINGGDTYTDFLGRLGKVTSLTHDDMRVDMIEKSTKKYWATTYFIWPGTDCLHLVL